MSSTAVMKPSPAASRFAAPSTPLRPSSAPATPQKSQQVTPGTWRHPNMDEINRRKNASTFNSDNVHRILVNATALLCLILAPRLLFTRTPSALDTLVNSMNPYAHYALLLARCIPLLNIALALLPLFRATDDMPDIALSREQRRLLGLKPQDTPLPAGSAYVTPPRYSRASTPRSSAQRAASGSPLSRRASPSSFDASTLGVSKAASSGSPFSVSPLMQKAVGGAAAASAARTSSSPLDASLGSGSAGLASGKASVALNSKWLYERGKGSPNARSVFA